MFYLYLSLIIGVWAYLIVRHLIRNYLEIHLTTHTHVNEQPDINGIRRVIIVVIDTQDPSMRTVRAINEILGMNLNFIRVNIGGES